MNDIAAGSSNTSLACGIEREREKERDSNNNDDDYDSVHMSSIILQVANFPITHEVV